MSRIEIFPKELLSVDKVEDVIKFLLGLPGRGIDRKEMLAEWCKYTGYPLTAELVRRVYEHG
jgi:hypothetical protein